MVITSGVRDKERQGMLFSSNCVYRKMFLLVYTLSHLLFYISCLMSGVYRYHLRYCGGYVGHTELHGAGSFQVGLSV